MTGYLDPITFNIVGENLNLCLHKDLRGTFVLTLTDNGAPVDLSGLGASLILSDSSCSGNPAGDVTLFSTVGGNITLDDEGNITLIVDTPTANSAPVGVYNYRFMLFGSAVQQIFSGAFEVDQD